MDGRARREGKGLLPGQYLSFRVSDTGARMTPDVIARTFVPFFTTKPIGHGTGLGGTVPIYSEPGKSSIMCIYMPCHDGEAEQAALIDAIQDSPRASDGETVLVVDDEPLVRMIATEQRGTGLLGARSGGRTLGPPDSRFEPGH